MRYRKVGRWGLNVSAVGLGSWLTYGDSIGEERALGCVQRAYDRGVNFFDTADEYAGGRAEEVLGKALSTCARSSFVVATKVFQPVGEGPNDRGLSRKHVMEQADASLRRLGTDYIDLYQCHRFDATVPLEETGRAMDDLVRAGKVLYWGVSEWDADQLARAASLCDAAGWAPPVSDQPQYSLLWRGPEAHVLPACAELGLGALTWAPLAMGVLTGKYRPGAPPPTDSRANRDDAVFMRAYLHHDVLDRVAQARVEAERAGHSLAHVALAWCLRRPEVTAVIVGATRPEHVDHAADVVDHEVCEEVLDRIGRLLDPAAQQVASTWRPVRPPAPHHPGARA